MLNDLLKVQAACGWVWPPRIARTPASSEAGEVGNGLSPISTSLPAAIRRRAAASMAPAARA